MIKETVNKIVITDEEISFIGFSTIEPISKISVFHTENSFTIYPLFKQGTFYTNFDIINKTINREIDTHGYALFRTMIEEIKDYPMQTVKEYQFVEINDVFMIIP